MDPTGKDSNNFSSKKTGLEKVGLMSIYRCKKRLLLVFETEMLHIDGLHLGHAALLGRLLEVLA